MFIRLALIFSLIAQQMLGYSCCGVPILRPDVVRPDCGVACTSSADCGSKPDLPASACCEFSSPVPFDVGDDQTRDVPTCSEQTCDAASPAPRCNQPTDCSPPVEHKKPGPDSSHVDVIAGIAHPLLPAPVVAIAAFATTAARPMPRWSTHQQRQAVLAVWLN